jgi:hypothetical protein
MASTYDTTVVVGDSLRFLMSATDVTGATYNFLGCTLAMQVRQSYYPSDKLYSSYTTYITSGSTFYQPEGICGGISATATGGIVAITVGSTYTNLFSTSTPVFYDIQVRTSNPRGVETLLRGKIDVFPDVTRG